MNISKLRCTSMATMTTSMKTTMATNATAGRQRRRVREAFEVDHRDDSEDDRRGHGMDDECDWQPDDRYADSHCRRTQRPTNECAARYHRAVPQAELPHTCLPRAHMSA